MRPAHLFLSLFVLYTFPGRFLPLFYDSYKLSPASIGLIISAPLLPSLVLTPLICNYADKRSLHARIASTTTIASSLFFIAQVVALPLDNPLSALLFLGTLYGILQAPLYPLVSALTLSYLRHQDPKDAPLLFGVERLWGAVSYAIAHVLFGIALDFSPFWIVHIALAFATVLFVQTLRYFNKQQLEKESQELNNPPDQTDQSDHSQNETLLSDIEETKVEEQPDSNQPTSLHASASSPFSVARALFSQTPLHTSLFFLLIFTLFLGMSLVENLLFLFFTSTLSASHTLCGLSVLITVIFEVPLFAHSPTLLRRLTPATLLLIGAFSYSIRAIGYAYVPNAKLVLLLEPLHGVTYASAHTASVAYVAQRTSQECEATAQSLLSAVETFSAFVGVSLGGWVMQHFGSRALYGGASLLVFSASLAFAVSDRIERSISALDEETNTDEDSLQVVLN